MDLIAYSERPSYDPDTGAPGVLRKEWRLRTADDVLSDPEASSYKDRAADRKVVRGDAHVLEMRYIRRGMVEPWRLVDTARSAPETFYFVDGGVRVIGVDPRFVQFLREIEKNEQRRAAEKAAKLEAQALDEEKKRLRQISRAAFDRLLMSPTGKTWALRWNELIDDLTKRAAADKSFGARVTGDEVFHDLHDAVRDATTVPAKRAGIRKALAYAEKQGWA